MNKMDSLQRREPIACSHGLELASHGDDENFCQTRTLLSIVFRVLLSEVVKEQDTNCLTLPVESGERYMNINPQSFNPASADD